LNEWYPILNTSYFKEENEFSNKPVHSVSSQFITDPKKRFRILKVSGPLYRNTITHVILPSIKRGVRKNTFCVQEFVKFTCQLVKTYPEHVLFIMISVLFGEDEESTFSTICPAFNLQNHPESLSAN
jgi:hypothetical protein